MFGLSWGQIGIILLVAVFVLGPDRIPTAVAGALTAVRRLRALVAGAQADTLGQFGPEIAELRRQLAELQALAGVSELRGLHPQKLLDPVAAAGPVRTDPAGSGEDGNLGDAPPVDGAPPTLDRK